MRNTTLLKAALELAFTTPPLLNSPWLLGKAMGQGQQPFGLDWQHRHTPETRPEGYVLTWLGDSLPPVYSTTYTQATAQGQDQSGRDWWHKHCNVYDSLGNHIGYAMAGFVSFVNHQPDDGCVAATDTLGRPFPERLERFDRRSMDLRCAVARADLDGNIIWHKVFQRGIFFDLIQDSHGDLVLAGETSDHWPLADMDAPDSLLFNPNEGGTHTALDTAYRCAARERHAFVMKLGLDGSVAWGHIFAPPTDTALTHRKRSSAQGIIETRIDEQMGYRLVGYAWPEWTNNNDHNRIYLVDLNADGLRRWDQLVDQIPGAATAEAWQCRGLAIARTPFAQGEHYAITGFRRHATQTRFSAYLWVMRNDTTILFRDTKETTTLYGNTDGNQNELSTRVSWAVDDTSASILWPVMSEFTTNGSGWVNFFASTNKQALAQVQRFSTNGSTWWEQPANLGLVRAFDLMLDAIPLQDGDIAVASTKWTSPYEMPSDPFGWDDLPEGVQDCITDPDTGLAYDPDGPGPTLPLNWQTTATSQNNYFYGYYGTDSYVAKIDGDDGSTIWETQWNEGTGAEATTCFPENFRRRQCNFGITEAADGGLVVCGNTGHNFDDAYLARLGNCDQLADYTNAPQLDSLNRHVLTSNTTWSTSRNIRGSIVVPNGVTLTINNGASIRFADSRAIGYTTNIVVQPGGKLWMTGSSTLTSLTDCLQSMWDGIIVLGDPALAHNNTGQGEVNISNSTISNAICGIYAGNGNIFNPYATSTASGGRVTMSNMTFTNNIHDVVMRPYANNGNNIPYTWTRCIFQTTAALNYPGHYPGSHVVMVDRPKQDLHGCTFRNTSGLYPSAPQHWGIGLHAINSNIWVTPPSIGAATTPTFKGLSAGIVRLNVETTRSHRVLDAHFEDCARGILMVGVDNARIVGNTFLVPDLDVDSLEIPAAYGSMLEECTGFLFEENTFTGPGTGADHPNVGAIFVDIGEAYNEFYNNTFDGFTDAGVNSAGTIIMGENDGPGFGDGLVIKCNDYSNTEDNDFDVAFTGLGVTIGDQQGNDQTAQSPAGNTFASDCNGEQHFFNPEEDIATFTYFHHDPNSTAAQIVPECATDPPIIVSGGGSWYESTSFQFTKEVVCPTASSMMMSMEGWMDEAEEQSSMLAESASISEAAHHHAQMAKALYRLTELALNDSVGTDLDLAIAAHEEMAMANSKQMRFGLHLAKGDTAEALMIMAEALEEDPGSVYWSLLNDYWDRLLAQEDPYAGEVSTSALEGIATSGVRGRSVAIAWLAGMGIRIPEYFILPGSSFTKRKATLHEDQPGLEIATWGLEVFPNPSEGLVQFRVLQPDGTPNAELHVYDIAGHTIAVHRINAQGLTSLSLQLAPGVYIAALDSGGLRQKQSKFMVIR